MLKFFLGLVVGISIGTVIAPERGEITRARIRQKAEELKEAGIERGRQAARETGADIAQHMYDRAVGEE